MKFNTFRLFTLAIFCIALYLWKNDDTPQRTANRKTRQVDTTLGKGYCPSVLNSIVVTYDEGPSYSYTDKLLNNLDTVPGKVVFHVNPTWLVSSQQLQLKVARAHNSGHQIGLRWRTTLDSSLPNMSVDDFMQQLVNDATFVANIVGSSTIPRFVRFPQGQLTAAQAAAVANAGFISTFWGIDSGDYNSGATVTSVVAAYTSKMDNTTSPSYRSSLIAINRDLYAVAGDAAVAVQNAIVNYKYSIITLDTCFNTTAFFTPSTNVQAQPSAVATATVSSVTEAPTTTPTTGAQDNTSSASNLLSSISIALVVAMTSIALIF